MTNRPSVKRLMMVAGGLAAALPATIGSAAAACAGRGQSGNAKPVITCNGIAKREAPVAVQPATAPTVATQPSSGGFYCNSAPKAAGCPAQPIVRPNCSLAPKTQANGGFYCNMSPKAGTAPTTTANPNGFFCNMAPKTGPGVTPANPPAGTTPNSNGFFCNSKPPVPAKP